MLCTPIFKFISSTHYLKCLPLHSARHNAVFLAWGRLYIRASNCETRLPNSIRSTLTAQPLCVPVKISYLLRKARAVVKVEMANVDDNCLRVSFDVIHSCPSRRHRDGCGRSRRGWRSWRTTSCWRRMWLAGPATSSIFPLRNNWTSKRH